MDVHTSGGLQGYCLACQTRLRRGRITELIAHQEQQAKCREHCGSLGHEGDHVLLCENCNTVYPFEVRDTWHFMAAVTIMCPVCVRTWDGLVALGTMEIFGVCIAHPPESKIYYCWLCIERRRDLGVFGFGARDGAGLRFFARLTKAEALERLQYLEDTPKRPGGFTQTIMYYRDLFEREPLYTLKAMPEYYRHYRYLLAFAHDFDVEEAVRARDAGVEASVRAAVAAGSVEMPACPNPRLLKRMDLDPGNLRLHVVPRRALGNGLLLSATVVSLLSVFLWSASIKVSLVALLAALAAAVVGLEVRSGGSEVVCERGEVTIRNHKRLEPRQTSGITNVEEVAVHLFSKGPRIHAYVDVADREAHPPPDVEHPVVQGLSIRHHDRRELVTIRRRFEFVLWVGRALVEAARAQGIYIGGSRAASPSKAHGGAQRS